MPRLVLHIGQTKTATTSIQFFCDRNRDQLIDYGIHYLKCPKNEISHRFLIHALELELFASSESSAIAAKRELCEMGFAQPSEELHVIYEKAWKMLADSFREVVNGSCGLLSEELLWHVGGFNHEGRICILKKLRDRLTTFVDPSAIMLLACIRHPVEWAESWHNQLVKDAGNQVSISRFIQGLARRGAFNYGQVMLDWHMVFPEASISIIDFHGQLLQLNATPGVSLLKTCGFLKTVEADEIDLLEKPPRLQESIHPFVHHWITRHRPPRVDLDSYRRAVARASEEVCLLSKKEFGNKAFTVLSESDIDMINEWTKLEMPPQAAFACHSLERGNIIRSALPRPLPKAVRSACREAFYP